MALRSPKRGLRVCSTVVVSWTLLVGCEESGPTAPSDPTIGIHVYTDENFQGSTAQFTSDKSHLANEENDADECRRTVGDDSKGAPWSYWLTRQICS